MDEHPFVRAWRIRDAEEWGRALASDVVLHSPILTAPFEGRAAAVDLYRVLFKTFGPVEIAPAFSEGSAHAFFWRAAIGRRTVDGVDLIRHDPVTGEIVDITVMIRPLVDIATFAAAVGPGLAQQRSRARGRWARALTLPLRPFFTAVDRISARLIG